MTLRTASCLVLASAALLVPPVAGGAQNQPASPLDSVRLLPPVLLKGEKRLSPLAERIRHHRVEAVAVALTGTTEWCRGRGRARRSGGKKATAESLFQAGSIKARGRAFEILRGFARQEGWKGYLPEPLVPVALPADDLRTLAGRYRVSGDEALSVESREWPRLRSRPGRPRVRAPSRGGRPSRPQGPRDPLRRPALGRRRPRARNRDRRRALRGATHASPARRSRSITSRRDGSRRR